MTVDLRAHIREVADFPKPGIGFKDITPLLLDPEALDTATHLLAEHARSLEADLIVAPEARGFLLGPAIARELGIGFVPARKPGKLPAAAISAEYMLEYGVDSLEMHADALSHGERVIIHDDLIATGGTVAALRQLCDQLGAEVVGASFIVELAFLDGRAKLDGIDVRTLVSYDAE